jgi:hypothetical protein
VLTRLRLITGVQRVSLASSTKSDSAVAGAASSGDSAGAGSAGSDDCRHGSRKFPKFSVVIFFNAPPTATLPGATGATGGTGGTPPSAGTAPQTAGQAGARAASTSGASQ